MVGVQHGLIVGALLLVVGVTGAGCAAGQDAAGSAGTAASGGDGGEGGGAQGASTTGAGDGGADASVTVGSTTSTGAGGDEPIAEVYGHSATTLYRLDPETKEVTIVNPFSGCDDQVIDIALDKDSNLYGTTLNRQNGDPVPNGGLWRIDKNTAACTLIARGDFPNSLSFVPAGTLDPDEEALVGYVGANYVRIDPLGGDITTVRANALTGGLVSSGDIVSVIDGPTLLTVKGGASCDDLDCVIEVDPATGAAVGNLGSAGFNNVFGVAFWAGSLYGFTSEGDLFELVKNENNTITTTPIPVASGLEFFGAGSTTSAPPTPVPN
jgi:hypothetical protein